MKLEYHFTGYSSVLYCTWKFLPRFFLCFCVSAILFACKPMPPKYSTAGQDIQRTLNHGIQTDRTLSYSDNSVYREQKSVKNSLLPPLTVETSTMNAPPPAHRFNVSANEMPAKNFFLGLVAGTSYNMVVDPGTTGNVTLNLKDVTIEQALDAARDMYGYQYKKTDMGYEILSRKMITQIFNINYLNINRSGQSQTQLVSTEITNLNSSNGTTANATTTTSGAQSGAVTQGSGSTVVTKAQNDFWISLDNTLKTLIGNQGGRWVVINPQASVAMVHAYPEELIEVSDYLKTIQNNLQREVIIDAKIL